MQAYEVIIAIGHMGRGKSREELRYLTASDVVAARDTAFSWGGVKRVIEVRPCTNPAYIKEAERGTLLIASDRMLERVG